MESKERAAQELKHRKQLWNQLVSAGNTKEVNPPLLRQLGIYGGAQGIWVDKTRTAALIASGVTVSVLHTGRYYDDDLTEEGVLYHYPNTNRPRGRDLAEVEATKATTELHLPLFVISYSRANPRTRDVYLGWVEGWDDEIGQFFILFGDEQPVLSSKDVEDTQDFELVDTRRPSRQQTSTLRRSPRFKFLTYRRYGLQCAVCGISAVEVLDAAHIRPKSEDGSDDPRNGLVLCALHHRAMDAGLFAIKPDTLRVQCKEDYDTESLLIKYDTLHHLRKKPHRDALEWLSQNWT